MTAMITDTSLTYHLDRAQQEAIMAVGSLLPVVEARHAELARLHSDHAIRLLVAESFAKPIPIPSRSPLFDLLATLHAVPFGDEAPAGRHERAVGGDRRADAYLLASPSPAHLRVAHVGDNF